MSAPYRLMLLVLPLLGTVLAQAGCESNREIVLSRKDMHNHAHLAQVYYDKGRLPQAIDQCRKALEVDDTFTKPLCILGYAYLQLGRNASRDDSRFEHFEEAESHLTQAVLHGSESDSFVFKSYFGLGLLYFEWAKHLKRQLAGGRDGSQGGAPRNPGKEALWAE